MDQDQRNSASHESHSFNHLPHLHPLRRRHRPRPLRPTDYQALESLIEKTIKIFFFPNKVA